MSSGVCLSFRNNCIQRGTNSNIFLLIGYVVSSLTELKTKEMQEVLRKIPYPPESEKMGLSRRGRKRKYQSKAEKQRAYRERKKSRGTLCI